MDFDFRWDEPVLSVTQTKRQHYVPRAYLRRFLEDDNQIRVVDMAEDREFRTSVENIAVERRFYDVEIDGVFYSAEDWLANVESQAMPVIEDLIQSPSTIGMLSMEDENYLSRFIAALTFRTPAFRDWDNTNISALVSQIKERVEAMFKYKLGESAGEQEFKKIEDKPPHWWLQKEEQPQPASSSVYMLGETQGFANLIRGAPWRIGNVLGPRLLYTSDNPVSRYLPPIRPWWDTGAFSSYEYYFPLSPKVLLKIERMPYKEESSAQDKPQVGRQIDDFSETEVELAHHIITFEATRFLYGEETIVPKRRAEALLYFLEQSVPIVADCIFRSERDTPKQEYSPGNCNTQSDNAS